LSAEVVVVGPLVKSALLAHLEQTQHFHQRHQSEAVMEARMAVVVEELMPPQGVAVAVAAPLVRPQTHPQETVHLFRDMLEEQALHQLMAVAAVAAVRAVLARLEPQTRLVMAEMVLPRPLLVHR